MDKNRNKMIRRSLMAILICLLVMAGLLIDLQADRGQWFRQPDAQASPAASSEQDSSAPDSDYDDLDPADPLQDSSSGNNASGSHENNGADEGQQAEDLIPVYLVGAVENPGIYLIKPGLYLYELVEMAGGMTEDAAAEQINLVLRIMTNQQIYLPTREEAQRNPSLLPAPGDSDPHTSMPLININTASRSELEKLPGVGPVTARAIIDHREKHGRFNQPEDIMQVPGIKESRYQALEDYIITGSN